MTNGSFINRTASFSSAEGPDYRFSNTSTNHLPAEWQLDIEDNDISLEFEDQLNLVYYPRPFNIITRFEADKQFVRNIASVYIEDNDRKPILILCNIKSVWVISFSKDTKFLTCILKDIFTSTCMSMVISRKA